MIKRLFLGLALLGALTAGAFDRSAWRLSYLEAEKNFRNGNFSQAAVGFIRLLAEAPPNDLRLPLGNCFTQAVQALNKLDRIDQFDALWQACARRHPRQPELLIAMAEAEAPAFGSLIDGVFVRGDRNADWQNRVYVEERDRAARLQLLANGLPAVEKRPPALQQRYFLALAAVLLERRSTGFSYRLQELTGLEKLPDFRAVQGDFVNGAPVDKDGRPVFYAAPASFGAAASDGERFRWALERAKAAGSSEAVYRWADFLNREFGLPAHDDALLSLYRAEDKLRTLPDSDFLARLADGVRLLTLPDEFNPIRILEREAEKRKPNRNALLLLADIRNRRDQFPREMQLLRQIIRLYGKNDDLAARIGNRTGRHGIFLPGGISPAGENAVVELLFRNADEIELSLQAIDQPKLLARWQKQFVLPSRDGEDILFSPFHCLDFLKPGRPFADCVGAVLKTWQTTLSPPDGYRDRKVRLELPVSAAGAYLLTGKIGDTTLQALVWINSIALFDRPLEKGRQLFVAGLTDGKPVAGAEVEVVSIRQIYARTPEELKEFGGRVKIDFSRQLLRTGENGELAISRTENAQVHYLAAGPDGDKALLLNVRDFANRPAAGRTRETGYIITDGPLYRPGDTVKFQIYGRQVDYAQSDWVAPLAGREVEITVISPRGNQVLQKTIKLDADAAGNWVLALPVEAELGRYRVSAKGLGSVSFRVEEFKKPEYKLTIHAPSEPIRFGSEVEIILEGEYYFGSPVSHAGISYKIERRQAAARPYRRGFWDYLFGENYWRCIAPWEPENRIVRRYFDSELIARGEGLTGPDGKFKLVFRAEDPDGRYLEEDCLYLVTAEIADSSRRIIDASAEIRSSHHAFRVHAHPTRGFFTAGRPAEIAVFALRADGQAIAGNGEFTVHRLTVENGKVTPLPEAVAEIRAELKSDASPLQIPIVFNEPGVYRFTAVVTDAAGESNSGDCIIPVCGVRQEAAGLFSSLPLQVTRDRETYQPGETAQLLISSRFPDATVFLFPRIETLNTDFQVLTLSGGSALAALELSETDRPNTFVDVVLLHGGAFYQASMQLPIPPQKKVLTVEAVPSTPAAGPGEEIKVKIKVTGDDGKPVDGLVTVTVYDAALEALAGGSNIPAILPFFWNFRRFWHSHFLGNSLTPLLDRWASYNAFAGRGVPFGGIMAGGPPAPESAVMTLSDSARSPAPMALAANKSDLNAAAMDTGGAAETASPLLVVRENFRDRIFWLSQQRLAADGTLELPLSLPDDLTRWKIKVWSLGSAGQVGEGEAEVVVSKDIIARLELPRFLIEGDRVIATATVHNYAPETEGVIISLKSGSPSVKITDDKLSIRVIPAGGNAVLQWEISALKEGPAEFVLTAAAENSGDALKLTIPVAVNGIGQQLTASGRANAESGKGAAAEITIPDAIRPGSARLWVDLSPSVALPMLRLLPHLAGDDQRNIFSISYRYLPALLVKRALEKTGVSLADIKPGTPELYAIWQRNPLSDPEKLDAKVAGNLLMLQAMQNSDGGWGWFSGFGESSYPDTTAYVVEMLLEAQAAGVKLPAQTLERGISYLEAHQRKQLTAWRQDKHMPNNLDAWVLHVLTRAGKSDDEAGRHLFRNRVERLSPYGLSLLGLAMQQSGRAEELAIILENLNEYAVDDIARGTSHLRIPDPRWRFFWYGNDTETQANYLRLLLRAQPTHPRIVPLTRYLTMNLVYAPSRNSLRALTAGIIALAEYLNLSGENAPDFSYRIRLDGQETASGKINGGNLLSFPSEIEIPPDRLATGTHKLEVEALGRGTLYFNLRLSFFNLASEIAPAGTEMKIARTYWLLTPKTVEKNQPDARGQLTGLQYEAFDRQKLESLAPLKPGSLVEVELNLDSGNDYDYVVIDDPRPAGFITVARESGFLPGWPPVYAEHRTRSSRFYFRNIRRGPNQIRYQLRAQHPGRFTALPATGSGLYAPLLHCNTEKLLLQIKE